MSIPPSAALVSTYTHCLLDDVVNLYMPSPVIDCDAFDMDDDHAENMIHIMKALLIPFDGNVKDSNHG